jgi:hypothetical protein
VAPTAAMTLMGDDIPAVLVNCDNDNLLTPCPHGGVGGVAPTEGWEA